MGENRAIQLTPAGVGAIAVVRIIGPDVLRLMESHFSKPLAAGRCIHGELRDGENVIDDPVAVLLPAGGVDLSFHGGTYIIESVLAFLARHGFSVRQDDGGAVSLDAVDGSDVLEREVNAWLALATTELGVRCLLNQRAAWAEFLRAAGAAPDEATNLSRRTARVEWLKSEVAQIVADRALDWLLHPPRVAIIGAPNVGKSTLANQLFARQRVITADVPGTTRDWVGEIANLDGLAVMLVDTPGIRVTEDAIEAQAISRSQPEIAGADLLLIVLDATRPLEGEQAAVLEAWPDAIRIINKTDQAPAWDWSRFSAIRIAAVNGDGIDGLRAAIRARFGCDNVDEKRPRLWTERQRKIVEDSAGSVELLVGLING